jgi:hypothetical protein
VLVKKEIVWVILALNANFESKSQKGSFSDILQKEQNYYFANIYIFFCIIQSEPPVKHGQVQLRKIVNGYV